MLSHYNIVSNVLESEKRVPFVKGKSKALSFLPVCHVFERMILYLYQYCGVEIYFEPARLFGYRRAKVEKWYQLHSLPLA